MARLRKVSVIGGGPAGMMAAIAATLAGARVQLFEKNASLGRKLMATGNGRCNYTNQDLDLRHFHGGGIGHVRSALAAFDGERTIGFFRGIGILPHVDDRGRCFPASNEAGSVLSALEQGISRSGAGINTRCEIVSIVRGRHGLEVRQRGTAHQCDAVVIACGGAASPQFGSNGSGFELARRLGHRIIPARSALAPIELTGHWFHALQGVRLDMELTVPGSAGAVPVTDEGLFTNYGLSGPLALRISRAHKPGDRMALSFIPGMDADKILPMLRERAHQLADREAAGFLAGWLPAKLGRMLIHESSIDPASPVASLDDEAFRTLARLMTSFPAQVKSLRPLKEAQVTAGGVDCDEIDPRTMQSKIAPGLFFCGEVVDVDGDSGGYNLQWCWSSGWVAGRAAARFAGED